MVRNKIFITLISFLFIVSISNADDNTFTVNAKMKEHILHSSFKIPLHRADKKELIAYLYAEDEISKPKEYFSCLDGHEKKTISKSGHYYIYLYDPEVHLFLPGRTAIFLDLDGIRMNVEGADIFVLSDNDKKKSDVLLISQFVNCSGDAYEAYGFSKNERSLINYTFFKKRKSSQFYGRVAGYDKHHTLIAYGIYGEYHKIYKYSFSLSDTPEEIRIKPEPW